MIEPAAGAPSRAACEALDAADPVGFLRDQFLLPEGVVYLDGNSLGPPLRTTAAALARLVEGAWANGLARSWELAGWWEQPVALGARLAPLLGAAADEVVVCDSTSVDLFKVVAAALGLRPGRGRVVVESDGFPTDGYVVAGLAELAGGVELHRVGTGALAGAHATETLAAAVDERTAAVVVGHVDYRSARVVDLGRLAAAAHRHGALLVADLAHSAGALPLALDDWGVDLAVGCTYKYLNGGPGAPAYLFVARRHVAEARQPLAGWSGHARPFDFLPRYAPDPGIRRFLTGTPSIVALAALDEALGIWEAVDRDALFAKGRALGETLAALVATHCPELELVSPPDPAGRGLHLAYRHRRAAAVVAALAARGVVADHRAPDLVRLGFAPAYVRFADLFDATEALRAVLDELPARPSS